MDGEQHINQNLARELSRRNAVLQEILSGEAIRTDDELREVQLRHSKAHFVHQPDISESARGRKLGAASAATHSPHLPLGLKKGSNFFQEGRQSEEPYKKSPLTYFIVYYVSIQ